MHVLAIGQSNIANHGATRQASDHGTAWHLGKSHPLADPVPGGSGERGSVWPATADLIHAKTGGTLDVTLVAVSGTSVADWCTGGSMYQRLATAIPTIRARHPALTHIVYHQGERDTYLGTPTEDYIARFRTLDDLLRATWPETPLLICPASLREGVISAAVRDAQNWLAQNLSGCRAGPDTDEIGVEHRFDRTHFADDGLDLFAEALADALCANA